jgi:hypothetical protein
LSKTFSSRALSGRSSVYFKTGLIGIYFSFPVLEKIFYQKLSFLTLSPSGYLFTMTGIFGLQSPTMNEHEIARINDDSH